MGETLIESVNFGKEVVEIGHVEVSHAGAVDVAVDTPYARGSGRGEERLGLNMFPGNRGTLRIAGFALSSTG
jgi:hypothetical protein